MRTKQLFFNALTVCILALAVLLSQAMFNISATAEKPGSNGDRDLIQRVADLEDQQEQSGIDFFLVDQSLADLDMRVTDNEARGLANKRAISDLRARVKTAQEAIAVQRADHRTLVRQFADLRALVTQK